jgi:hypothetical protein
MQPDVALAVLSAGGEERLVLPASASGVTGPQWFWRDRTWR